MPAPISAPDSASARDSARSVVAAVTVGVWTVAVTVGIQTAGWLADQLLLISGLPQPAWGWQVASWLNALLVGGPAALLAVIPRGPAVRAAGRIWLLGAVALGLLGSARAVPATRHELYLAVFTATAGLLALLFTWLFTRRTRKASARQARQEEKAASGRTVWLAVAAGLAILLPWWWLGALGGGTETLLAVAAGASVGALTSSLLGTGRGAGHPRPHRDADHPRRPCLLVQALVAAVGLLLIGAATGASGEHLAEMLVLPPLGLGLAALAALAAPRPASPDSAWPARWLVGLAAIGPLAFVDNEEVTLLLVDPGAPQLGRDIPVWTATAAAVSLAIGVLLGVAYATDRGRRVAAARRRVLVTAVVCLVVASAGVYAGLGQPGFFGDRLFVVMREQADLSGIDTTGGGQARRDERAQATYQTLVRVAERSQAALRRDLDRLHLSYTPYYLVNAIEVDGGPGVRAWLSRRDDVDRVLLAERLRPLPAAPTSSRGDLPAPASPAWNVTALGADQVWTRLGDTGAGIVVGTSDSGVDSSHPALSAGFRGGDDSWYDPWRHTRTPNDTAGHGTHTLATAVGRTQTGVAPGARWVGCVNLHRNLGNPARYLDCLQFMLAPFPHGGDPFTDGRPERAPHVLTNSWGCPKLEGCDSGALRPATAALAAAGIFVVVAAGNTGPLCGSVDDPPAPYPDVFTVGAVDRDRRVTAFSSRGPADAGVVKPDAVAPGAAVLSAWPDGGYATLDGTSMATPHVAGTVALMWSANPALIGDLARTTDILRHTATPAGLTRPSRAGTQGGAVCGNNAANVTGAGMVDAYAAVQAARATS